MESFSDLGVVSAVLAGISLSAASGLRVFLPMLGLGIATRYGWLEVGEQFAWLASEPVLAVLAIAALLEVGAYYIPLVDNLLDLVATPAALAGGTVILAALLPDMNPASQWLTAATVGGGAAGIVQVATVFARGLSTASSGGLANSLLATGETTGSVLSIGLALLIPILFGLFVIVALAALLLWIMRRLFRRSPSDGNHPPSEA